MSAFLALVDHRRRLPHFSLEESERARERWRASLPPYVDVLAPYSHSLVLRAAAAEPVAFAFKCRQYLRTYAI